jgi:hypothetical protein
MTIVRNDGTWRSMLEHSERIAQFVLGRLASPAVHRQTVLGLELGHGRLGRRPYVISNSAASIFCDI